MGATPVATKSGSASTFARNSVLSVARLILSTAIGFVLPSFLIHRLPVATYSAWVLILQVTAYVNYLDLGIQTGIAKYVAEFDAHGDADGASRRASAGLLLLLIVSALGVLLTLGLAFAVPRLFTEMPPGLYPDVRLGLVFVGTSTAFGLLCSIFSSIFTGLQRFGLPTVIALTNRLLFVAVVLAAVYLHSSLAVMGALVALVNVATGLLSLVAWRKLARHVRLSLLGVDYGVLREMMSYCSTLAIWTAAMLCISGLDVAIVGRYDFRQTAFYAIATTPANFMIGIMGAAMSPLMPSAAALSVHRTPQQMGNLLGRATRYSSLILTLSALPLIVAGYWVLYVWVGPVYATQIVGYMRILVIGSVVRNTLMPYANMMIATNSQRVAIIGAIAEATVNLTASIYLVKRIGAMGVAYGTLIGSIVSVTMHFTVSMRSTKVKLAISRARVGWAGLGMPVIVCLPSLLLFHRWRGMLPPALGRMMWSDWALSTILLAWLVGLTAEERGALLREVRMRLGSAIRSRLGN